MSELVMWQCETCGATYPEYVNGCPKCWHGESGQSPEPEIRSPVRQARIQIEEEADRG
jgi:hypothetical protein